MSATERVALDAPQKLGELTYRESKVVTGIVSGKSEWRSIQDAGFNLFYAKHPNLFEPMERIRAEVIRLTAKVIEHGFRECLVTAEEIHEQLTDELRGDIADLYNPVDPTDSRFNPDYKGGELLPIPLWPLWARNGGVEVFDEPNMVHSDDDGGGSWDQKGRKIRVRMSPRHKPKELAMKHRGVNAMVDQKGPDVHVHLHAEITQRLQGALARKARLIEGKDETK